MAEHRDTELRDGLDEHIHPASGRTDSGIGYMTGDLNNLAQHIALGIKSAPVAEARGPWDTHWRRASLLGGLWIAFLSGAVLGAAFGSRLAVWTLLLPALMLLALAVAERNTISEG